VFIHAKKSAEVFVAPTNQFVDDEVSHALDLLADNNMENSRRDFDLKLVSKTPHCCGTAVWTTISWQKKSLRCGWK